MVLAGYIRLGAVHEVTAGKKGDYGDWQYAGGIRKFAIFLKQLTKSGLLSYNWGIL
jgi:hypothetical protein